MCISKTDIWTETSSLINFFLQLSQALETFSAVWESRLIGLGDFEFSVLSPSLSAIEPELGEALLRLDGRRIR
jgi:hypothetical protein